MNKRKKRRLIVIYLLTIAILFLLFAIPLQYYLVFPGELIDLGEVVKIEDFARQDESHFFAISSSVYENHYSNILGLSDNVYEVNIFVYAVGRIMPSMDVVRIDPSSRDSTTEEIKSYGSMRMNQTKEISINLALEYLGMNKTDINISFGTVAGPSGSMMTALEIINQLGSEDIIRGRRIAGSGVLDENGTVEAIGALNQKIYAAEKGNANILIIPKLNKEDMTRHTMIKILYVENLTDAISQLLE